MNLAIEQLSYYIPENQITLNDHYATWKLSKSDSSVYGRFYGIDKIPVSSSGILNLMKCAVEPLIHRLGDRRDRIKYILTPRTAPQISQVSQSLTSVLSSTLHLDNAVVFSSSMNKCVSALCTLQIMNQLLANALSESLGLIICAESVFTEQHRVLPNITIAGDAAVAMLISRNHSESTHRLVAISKKIYGEYAKGMWMTLEKVSEFGKQFEPGFAKVIHDVLKKADLTLADIKLVLPNNTNIPCWRNLAKYLQIPFDKVYLKNIPRTAHCFNADNFINVATAIEQGELQRGDYYLLLTIGVGAVFGAAVLQY